MHAALCLWALQSAAAAVYTTLDGVRAEARATHRAHSEPMLIGLPGEAALTQWQTLQHGSDEGWLSPVVAADADAMRRALLLSEIDCGLRVERYGRRGYESSVQCAAPTTATVVFTDGQRLTGTVSPGGEGHLSLTLQAGSPLVVPLDAVSALLAP
ncbi:MAG: hypothetical protein ACI8S6_000494 [Myxococcota bacterium]